MKSRVTALVSLAACASQVVSAASPADIFSANTGSMVFITTTNGDQVIDTGSGFVVSPDGYVVTAAHLHSGVNDVLHGVIGARQGVQYTLTFIDEDRKSDVAVWRLPQLPGCRQSVIFSDQLPNVLDRMLAMGFPENSGLSPASFGIANGFGDHGWLKADGSLSPGNSGGPVFNEGGQVAAIVQGGKVVGAADNDLVPVAPAIALLIKHDVSFVKGNGAISSADHCRHQLLKVVLGSTIYVYYQVNGHVGFKVPVRLVSEAAQGDEVYGVALLVCKDYSYPCQPDHDFNERNWYQFVVGNETLSAGDKILVPPRSSVFGTFVFASDRSRKFDIQKATYDLMLQFKTREGGDAIIPLDGSFEVEQDSADVLRKRRHNSNNKWVDFDLKPKQ